MSTTPPEQPAPDENLQFDEVEQAEETEAPTAATCARCSQPLAEQYYEIDGQAACVGCTRAVHEERTGGSRLARFSRALLYGLIAGVIGAGIWYGIRAATGYEIGLVAIVVGLIVGGAVRAGCRGRGGWLYQALAILLTYGSVVSTYVPDLISEWDSYEPQPATSAPATAGDPNAAAPQLAPPDTLSWNELSALGKTLSAVFLFAVLCILLLPAMIMDSDIIGLLILGFALYEAWKINKRPRWQISGPYALAAATEPTIPAESAPAPPTDNNSAPPADESDDD